MKQKRITDKINTISGVSHGPAALAIQGLIQDLDQFLMEDFPLAEDFCETPLDDASESKVTDGAVEEQCLGKTLQEPEVPENGNVQAKISEIKQTLVEVETLIARKDKVFLAFSDAVTHANKMLTKTWEAITVFKSTRRRLGDGIETKLFDWMKLLFKVQQPAYHGGKVIGKDCTKMM